MNPEAAALASLRGLHLPNVADDAIQGEFVAALVLGFAAALLVGLVRHLRARRQASVRRAALRELGRADALEPQARRVMQARLLRRLVRTLHGDAAAALRGPAWAETLDRTFATDFFSRGAGQTLVDGLYRRPGPADDNTVQAELRTLMSRIKA